MNHSTIQYLHNSVNYTTQLPNSAIPTSKKNDTWKHRYMDVLENIGVSHVNKNERFQEYYDMMEGKISKTHVTSLPNVVKEMLGDSYSEDEDSLEDLKHYDLIGIFVNAMTSENMESIGKVRVVHTGETFDNQYLRERTKLYKEYLIETLNKEVEVALISAGFDPNSNSEFATKEEQEAYRQQIQQKRQEFTPEGIEKYLSKDYKTVEMLWAENTLEQDYIRYNIESLNRQTFRKFLLTGLAFRHFYISHDKYEIEFLEPKEVFFPENIDSKYLHRGEYLGWIRRMTSNQVLQRFGYLMTKKQQELIANIDENLINTVSSTFPFGGGEFRAGQDNYIDRQIAYRYQNETGLPAGVITEGEGKGKLSYVPQPFLGSMYSGGIINRNIYQVTEAYFVTQEKIGWLKYTTDDGIPISTIVTDSIDKGFIKDNQIKEYTNLSIEEYSTKSYNNCILWTYVPKVRHGIKIPVGKFTKFGTDYSEDSIYLDMEVMENQLRGHSNLYDTIIPVASIVTPCFIDRILMYQRGYNFCMNQAYNWMEKELGVLLVIDKKILGGDLKDSSDREDILATVFGLAKDSGMILTDTTRDSLNGDSAYNTPMAMVQNLSFTSQIENRMQMGSIFKNLAFEQIGFSPQRLGNVQQYSTEEGVKQGQRASYALTENYFKEFEDFLIEASNIHLNVAQIAQVNGKDSSVIFTKSDGTIAYLQQQLDLSTLNLAELGVSSVSDSKSKMELSAFKDFIMNQNTMGNDLLALAELRNSDTMQSVLSVAKDFLDRKVADEQRQQGYAMEQMEKQAQLSEQAKLAEYERLEISKQKDREVEIYKAEIRAEGDASSKDTSVDSLKAIQQTREMALKQEQFDDKKLQNQISNLRKENDLFIKEKAIESNIKAQQKSLELRERQLEQRERERQTKELSTLINA